MANSYVHKIELARKITISLYTSIALAFDLVRVFL